ncbi:MAG: rhamnulokinase [Ruminococcus sp.]|nr:rhamnulokinase [Ruminococcus sp.]
MAKRVLAFDFGASGGRAVIVGFDGAAMSFDEVHRFSNDPVMLNGTFYWDALRLFFEIKQGLVKAKLAGGFDSIAINTWGVDFGLLDENGELLQNPVHYRDTRTRGMLKKSEKYISNSELYLKTGNQLMEINTAFQLLALKEKKPGLLKRARRLLFMPDLLAYFLTGKEVSEYSIASTSQLFDQAKGDWNYDVIDAFGFDRGLFARVVKSGTVIGQLNDEICEELGIPKVPVIAACGHDTQDAAAAVPTNEKDFAFLSCGTWSLLGTELDAPLINDTTMALNLTNEGGFGGTTTLLNNIIGLWLIQESRRQWQREGKNYSFAEMEKMARECEGLKCLIDPDFPDFSVAGDIPKRIREYCKKTGQPIPESDGEVVRCIYESLALKYAWTIERLQKCTGQKYDTLYIVGGGTKDGFLCQMTADCLGIKVSSGPVEATVLGNAAIQLITLGEIADIAQAREMISKTQQIKRFAPDSEKTKAFAAKKAEFDKLLA